MPANVIKIGANEIAGELKARANKTPGELQKAMKRAAMRGRAMLVRRTPKDLGQAKAGWKTSKFVKSAKGGEIDLYNDNPYVGVLERGARPHKVSFEGRMAIYEWVLRNIPPAMSGPVQPYNRKTKTGGRKEFNRKSEEGLEVAAMEITTAIIRKLRLKGQKPRYFVKKSMDELNKDFGKMLNEQIAQYAKRRAKRAAARAAKGGHQ